MDVVQIAVIVSLVAASVLCVVAIWALREVVGTARSLRVTSDEVRARLIPLLDKADVTVDAINVELLRIDGIITEFEDTSSRVSHASATISDIVNAPAELVSGAATRMRQAWKDRKRHSDQSAADRAGVQPGTDEDADTTGA